MLGISVLSLFSSSYNLTHHKDYLVIVATPSDSEPRNALGYHVIITMPLWTPV